MLNDDINKAKLDRALHECNMHELRLKDVNEIIQGLFPLDLENYKNLSKMNVMALDQFIYRFTKLQDSMGMHLFSAVLIFLKEDIRTLSFIDILNKLEKLEIIESKDQWLELRAVRNQFAHEYGDDKKNISVLNQLVKKQSILINVFEKIKEYIKSKR